MTLGMAMFIIGTIFLIIGFIFTLKTDDNDYWNVSMYSVLVLTLISKLILGNYLKEPVTLARAIPFIVLFTIVVYIGFYWVYKKERKKNEL